VFQKKRSRKSLPKREKELIRQERLLPGSRKSIQVKGKTAILIDDGLATGASMRAAVQAARLRQPARIVVAVLSCILRACQEFKEEVDETICGMTPPSFMAVGRWYEDFSQTAIKRFVIFLAQAQEFVMTRKGRQ